MKKIFETPEINISKFDVEDIITSSNIGGGSWDNEGGIDTTSVTDENRNYLAN